VPLPQSKYLKNLSNFESLIQNPPKFGLKKSRTVNKIIKTPKFRHGNSLLEMGSSRQNYSQKYRKNFCKSLVELDTIPESTNSELLDEYINAQIHKNKSGGQTVKTPTLNKFSSSWLKKSREALATMASSKNFKPISEVTLGYVSSKKIKGGIFTIAQTKLKLSKIKKKIRRRRKNKLPGFVKPNESKLVPILL
jgi:hypothetical protein